MDIHNFGGEGFKLGCTVPPQDHVFTTATASSIPGFRIWSKVEIEDAIRARETPKLGERFQPNKGWIFNQGQVGSCFKAGTLVRMADGSNREIQDVELTEEVLTAEGNIGKVLTKFVREHDGDMYVMETSGCLPLEATEEHPILTKRGYVPIKDVTAGDYVCLPKYAPGSVKEIVPTDYLQPNSRGRYNLGKNKVTSKHIPGKPTSETVESPLPEKIKLSPEFGRILGLFLAEGSISYGKVTWHFHTDELATIAGDLVSLLKSELGLTATVVTGRGGRPNVTEVKIYGTQWCQLFSALGSTGAHAKRLHPDMTSGPVDFLRSVLESWTDGDGLGRTDSNGGGTVSKELAADMFNIANKLGLRPRMNKRIGKLYPNDIGKVQSRRDCYLVPWSKQEGGADGWQSPNLYDDEKAMWKKVNRVTKSSFKGHVYNLHVQGDNSYVAEGFGVHNCCPASAKGALRRAMFMSGVNDIPDLNHEFTYAQTNRNQDGGAILEEVAKSVQEVGMPKADWVRYPPNKFIFSRQYPPEATRDAHLYRASSVFMADTEDELATLILSGMGAAVVAVHVGNNFNSLDAKGFPGAQSWGVGNHAVGIEDVEILDGRLAFHCFNSWGINWGAQGYCRLDWNKHLTTTTKHHKFFGILSVNVQDHKGEGPVAQL